MKTKMNLTDRKTFSRIDLADFKKNAHKNVNIFYRLCRTSLKSTYLCYVIAKIVKDLASDICSPNRIA